MLSLEDEKREFLTEFTYYLILASKHKIQEQELEVGGLPKTKAEKLVAGRKEEEKGIKTEAEGQERKMIPRSFPTGVKITVQQIQPVAIKPITKEIEEPKPESPPEAAPVQQQKPQFFMTGIFKIDELLKDDTIKVIECANGDVKIKRDSDLTGTSIMLTNQEIMELIKKFSEAVKEPLTKNIFKASVLNLRIVAVISDMIGPRFIITRE